MHKFFLHSMQWCVAVVPASQSMLRYVSWVNSQTGAEGVRLLLAVRLPPTSLARQSFLWPFFQCCHRNDEQHPLACERTESSALRAAL